MYRDSYIVALMVGGKIQKESDDGTVLIPFGSEYVIRLKNKLRKRAVADVWLDGRVAAKGIVIDANGTVDLERFVEDGNLSEGKRFKLARLTDAKVEQPNDSENGTIEVNFYPEKDEPVVEKIVTHEYKHDCWNHNWIGHCHQCCNNSYCGICYPYAHPYIWKTYTTASPDWSKQVTSSGNITVTGGLSSSGIVGQAVNGNIDLSSNQMSNTIYSASVDNQLKSSDLPVDAVFMNASMGIGEAAATVEGSSSTQKFSYTSIDVDRSKPTTIRLTVRGLSKVLDVCTVCGYKRKKDVKFCPNDGTQLVA
jgi:hypothetical protein